MLKRHKELFTPIDQLPMMSLPQRREPLAFSSIDEFSSFEPNHVKAKDSTEDKGATDAVVDDIETGALTASPVAADTDQDAKGEAERPQADAATVALVKEHFRHALAINSAAEDYANAVEAKASLVEKHARDLEALRREHAAIEEAADAAVREATLRFEFQLWKHEKDFIS
jgi:hypothetical protein